MQIDQIYTACLSQASYFIESNGEAAVIDPIRERIYFTTTLKSVPVFICTYSFLDSGEWRIFVSCRNNHLWPNNNLNH